MEKYKKIEIKINQKINCRGGWLGHPTSGGWVLDSRGEH